jgi:hypothetical protein
MGEPTLIAAFGHGSTQASHAVQSSLMKRAIGISGLCSAGGGIAAGD